MINKFMIRALLIMIGALILLMNCEKPHLVVNPDPKQVADLGTAWNPDSGYSAEADSAYRAILTPQDWMEADNLDARRFGIMHAEDFMTTAAIAKGAVVKTPTIHLYDSFNDVEVETSLGTQRFETWVDNKLDGCIIVYKGAIVYEKYPYMRPVDKHVWFSTTKSLSGTLVGLLEAEGLIDVSLPIETYITEFEGSEWAGTPVIDILDMASGMLGRDPVEEPYESYDPIMDAPLLQFLGTLGLYGIVPTIASTYEFLPTVGRQKPYGEKYEYNNLCTFVCGWLAEKVSGKPFPQLLSERIWSKMGAEQDGIVSISPEGACGTLGLFSSTLRDMARYGMLFTPSWPIIANEQVIPNSLIEKIQNDGRASICDAGINKPAWSNTLGEEILYGTRQWDFVMDDGDFGKGGAHGQGLYISPDKDMVMAFFATHDENFEAYRYARTIAKLLELDTGIGNPSITPTKR